ncbi:hypothetical protein HK097_010221 [Rhizophlyctis rosea]|uniref:Reverse transcriptase zinc-binding domain-containing protein n=1 Tax=Rhizophlyctis rosea TaxID=64517 RepID=A0AAD5X7H7_9FUNG|nr:hypothetical protein HK097_010221 [Rhizophlyctis rosea]
MAILNQRDNGPTAPAQQAEPAKSSALANTTQEHSNKPSAVPAYIPTGRLAAKVLAPTERGRHASTLSIASTASEFSDSSTDSLLSRQMSITSTSSTRSRATTFAGSPRPSFPTLNHAPHNPPHLHLQTTTPRLKPTHLRERSKSTVVIRTVSRKRAQSSPSTIESVQTCATRRWSTVIGDLSWEGLFPHLTSKGRRTLFEDQLYWKLLQRRVPVNGYLKPKPGNSLACPRCGDSKETIEHWAFECVASREFWDNWRGQVSKLVGMELPEVTLRDVVGLFPDVRGRLGVEAMHALTIAHGVALWSLWGARAFTSVDTCPSYDFFLARLRARILVEYHSACEYDPSPYAAFLSAQSGPEPSSPESPSHDFQMWNVNERFSKRWCGRTSDVELVRGWVRFEGEWKKSMVA